MRHMTAAVLICTMVSMLLCAGTACAQDNTFPGRWNLTIYAPAGVYPSWFELVPDGGELTGRFVGRFGSARPIDSITVDGAEIHIEIEPQYESRDNNLVFEGTLFYDGVLRGSFFDEFGNWVYFAGHRAPELPAQSSVSWGAPVELLSGSLADTWHPRHEGAEGGWTLTDGVLANDPPTADLISNRAFNDFKLHLEYAMEEDSNSGVYLRGRYEVQLLDSFGNDPGVLENAAVYGFVAPSRQTIKPAGQWNELDITLTGRMLTVVLNGAMVLEKYEIPGITGGALSSDEAAPGPLMLQGDHGPVKFRNIVVWPAE